MSHFGKPEPFDLTRDSEAASPLIALGGSANVKVQMDWSEGGQERNSTQTVRIT
jgi:hypothetical protein